MIRFLVTTERVNEILTPSEYFGLVEGKIAANYHAMLKFMVDDKDNYLTVKQAEKIVDEGGMNAFYKDYLPAFAQALKDAFVSPTSAGS
jgi:hypothetical protein